MHVSLCHSFNRIVNQKTKHKISGVGVRYRLALSKHRWGLQQAWGDQKVLASVMFFGSLDFFLLRYDVREGGAQRRPVAELVWVEESKV